MREHFEKNSLFSKHQSAYRKFFLRKQSSLRVAKVTKDWLLILDGTKSTFYIGLDLSVALDKLNCELLLSVFGSSLGFRDKVLSFLSSFPSSRSQKLWIHGEYSMPRKIKTGVLQGFVLGPFFSHAILFL